MARFEPNTGGLDSLSTDLRKLGQLTNEDAWTILTPAAELLEGKFMDKIRTIFTQRTGKLAAAIQSFRRVEDGPVILVYPDGAHHRYRSRKKKGGGMKTAQASEVGFVLEYGSSRHQAYHWMENTIEEETEAVGEALQEGFDLLCEEKGIG